MDDIDRVKEEISKREQELRDLKTLVAKATGDEKAKLEAQIKELQSKIDDVNAKWEKLQSQGKGILGKFKK